MARINIPVRPLTREAFRPFGDVIQASGSRHRTISQGWAELYMDLAQLDDRIDLSAIDADVHGPGDQAFAYLGEGPLGPNGIAIWRVGRDTLVVGDIDGDADPDFSVRLFGDHAKSLDAGDFVL